MFWTGYLYWIGSTGVLLNTKGKRRFIWVVSYLFVWLLLVFVVWMWVTVLVSPSDWPWWSPPSRAASRWGSPPCWPDSCSAPGSPSPSSEPDAAPPAGPGAPVRSRTSTRRPSSAVCGAPGVSPSARTSPHRAGSQSPAGTVVILFQTWLHSGPKCFCRAPLLYLNVLVPGADGFEQVLDLILVLLGLARPVSQDFLEEAVFELEADFQLLQNVAGSCLDLSEQRAAQLLKQTEEEEDNMRAVMSAMMSAMMSACVVSVHAHIWVHDVKTLFNLRMNLQRLVSFQPVL